MWKRFLKVSSETIKAKNKDTEIATNQGNTKNKVLGAAKKGQENWPTLRSPEQLILDLSKCDYVHRPLNLTRPRKIWKRK